jgi:type IV pilus assembly protein PilP
MRALPFLLMMVFSVMVAAQDERSTKNFFKDKTKIDNPFNLRDPFKAPLMKGEGKRSERGFEVTGKGQYSNISEAPLEQLNVGNLKVLGVLIGKERRAMVSNGGKGRLVILKEGMKIGPEGTELKAILPGGIVLVEKIVNVYGEEEFLETVVPISK